MGKYDHIINMSHHKSSKHLPMSQANRAAQFAPFAALVGYGQVINETARMTESKRVLSDDQIEIMNIKLRIIQSRAKDNVIVEVTYFKSDANKRGGSYITVKGCFNKIDEFKRTIELSDNTTVDIDSIVSINSDIFDTFIS